MSIADCSPDDRLLTDLLLQLDLERVHLRHSHKLLRLEESFESLLWDEEYGISQ